MKEFDTPILFIIFNRPDTTHQVFEKIRQIKPKKLFISADGPRYKVKEDLENCKLTRSIIDRIDWNCEVYKNFNDENLGCKRAPCQAINWFFNNVDNGIILEDDCLPSQAFFYFCKKMLQYY